MPGDEPPLSPNVPRRETRTYLGDYLDGTIALSGPEPVTSAILPGSTRLLLSGEMLTGGHDHLDGWGGGDQVHWDNNELDAGSGMGKLCWSPDHATEIWFGADLHRRERGWTDWAWSRYETPYVDPESGDTLAPAGDLDYALPTRYDSGRLLTLGFRRSIGGTGMVEMLVSRQSSHEWNRISRETGGSVGDGFTVDDWIDYVQWPGYPWPLIDADGFVRSGVSPALWHDSKSSVSRAVLGASVSIGSHSLEASVEGSHFDVFEYSVSAVDSGASVDRWTAFPNSGAAWAQDRVDFASGLSGTVGVRLDRFDPRYDFAGRGTPTMPGRPARNDGPLPEGSISAGAPSKTWLSPRLGLVQQIGPEDAIRASYGHYAQMPALMFLYYRTGEDSYPEETPLLGNPDLGPEKTVSIEVGYDHSFGSVARVGLTGFYRDMDDLVATITRVNPDWGAFRQFVNGAYCHCQGAEVSISGRPAAYMFGSADLTVSWTRNLFSSPLESAWYYWESETIPSEECPSDFDRRWSLDAMLGGEVPGSAPWVGGLGISTVTVLRSGLPYDNAFHGVYPIERNVERYPITTTTDVHLWKGMPVFGTEVTACFDIFNMFDRKNISWIVDSVWYDAEMDGGGRTSLDPKGPMANGHAYAPRRHFLLGLRVSW